MRSHIVFILFLLTAFAGPARSETANAPGDAFVGVDGGFSYASQGYGVGGNIGAKGGYYFNEPFGAALRFDASFGYSNFGLDAANYLFAVEGLARASATNVPGFFSGGVLMGINYMPQTNNFTFTPGRSITGFAIGVSGGWEIQILKDYNLKGKGLTVGAEMLLMYITGGDTVFGMTSSNFRASWLAKICWWFGS